MKILDLDLDLAREDVTKDLVSKILPRIFCKGGGARETLPTSRIQTVNRLGKFGPHK